MKKTIAYEQYGCYGTSTVFESNAKLHGVTFEEELENRIAELVREGATIIEVK